MFSLRFSGLAACGNLKPGEAGGISGEFRIIVGVEGLIALGDDDEDDGAAVVVTVGMELFEVAAVVEAATTTFVLLLTAEAAMGEPTDLLLDLDELVVRSRGLFSDVGVSQLLFESDRSLHCFWRRLRLLASAPWHGELRPVMGRSVGGSRGTMRVGLALLSGDAPPASAMSILRVGGQRSAVLGVVTTGVMSMSPSLLAPPPPPPATPPSPFCEAAAAAASLSLASMASTWARIMAFLERGEGVVDVKGGEAVKRVAESGKNLGVVSISSDEVEDRLLLPLPASPVESSLITEATEVAEAVPPRLRPVILVVVNI